MNLESNAFQFGDEYYRQNYANLFMVNFEQNLLHGYFQKKPGIMTFGIASDDILLI